MFKLEVMKGFLIKAAWNIALKFTLIVFIVHSLQLQYILGSLWGQGLHPCVDFGC